METPPVPWISTVAPGRRFPQPQGVPGGDGGAWQRVAASSKLRCSGMWHETGILEHDIFGQHAVDVAAQSAAGLGLGGRAVEPILHEDLRQRARRA